jgi:hypothetical protein
VCQGANGGAVGLQEEFTERSGERPDTTLFHRTREKRTLGDADVVMNPLLQKREGIHQLC